MMNSKVLRRGIILDVNECIHAWRERSESSQHCKVSADCQQLDAECVFSPLSDGYICCRLKKDAVAPGV